MHHPDQPAPPFPAASASGLGRSPGANAVPTRTPSSPGLEEEAPPPRPGLRALRLKAARRSLQNGERPAAPRQSRVLQTQPRVPTAPAGNDRDARALRPAGDTCPRARSAQAERRSPSAGRGRTRSSEGPRRFEPVSPNPPHGDAQKTGASNQPRRLKKARGRRGSSARPPPPALAASATPPIRPANASRCGLTALRIPTSRRFRAKISCAACHWPWRRPAPRARRSGHRSRTGSGRSCRRALDDAVEASCPVIALLSAKDPAYVHEAAKRGVFAYIVDGSAEELQSAIDITLQRFRRVPQPGRRSRGGRRSSRRRGS
jgi:hypothetical protein